MLMISKHISEQYFDDITTCCLYYSLGFDALLSTQKPQLLCFTCVLVAVDPTSFNQPRFLTYSNLV